MTEALVRCAALEVGYRGRAVLPPLDLAIGSGEIWAVVGRNGAGKSTWLRTLLGLLPPVRGSVRWERPRPRLAYLAQESSFDPAYPLSVLDVVRQGAERGWSFASLRARRQAADAASAALERLGLRELSGARFASLSSGQRQRVLFARLAASAADLAVLDEPTSAMDAMAERAAIEELASLQRGTPLALVVVSHHLGLLRSIATHALFVDGDRSAVLAGRAGEVFRDPRLLASIGNVPEPVAENRA